MYKLLLVVGAVACLLMTTLFADAAQATQWPSNDAEIMLAHQTAVADIPDSNCRYQYQQFRVVGEQDPKNVCVNLSSGGLVIGAYQDTGRYYYVAGSAVDETLYQLQGCSGTDVCMYAPGQDVLFVKQHLINSIVYSLTVYKDVSENLQLVYDETYRKLVYRIDMSQPDYVFQSSDGYAWPIGGWALSANERWLVFELRERGYGVMDLESMTVKRISSKATKYNQGMNPRVELAITNDGSTVTTMGLNVGARMIVGTDVCGDYSTDDQINWNAALTKPCVEVWLPVTLWISDFLYGHLPKFDSSGSQLTFYTSTKQGTVYQLSLRPQSYSSTSVSYLALGDSFTSGEGETSDEQYVALTNAPYAKCHTSSRSYPFLVGRQLAISEALVKNVACSGAQIDDISGREVDYWGQNQRLAEEGLNLTVNQRLSEQQQALVSFVPGVVHQEKFIDMYHPPLVTVGVGGNDAGLFGKLKTCLMPETCEWADTRGRIYQTGKEIDGLKERLVGMYNKLTQLSPSSEIYVIGYPHLISEVGECGALGTFLDRKEQAFFAQSIAKLNSTIKAAAFEADVTYIDVADVFDGHQLCQDAAAVNSMRLGDDIALSSNLAWLKIFGNESFHPTPFGHELLADRIANAIEGGIENSSDIPLEESYWADAGDDESPRQVSMPMLTNIDLLPTDALSLSLPAGILKPLSSFVVSLHSDPTYLGQWSVEADGSIDITVGMPSSVSPGFHTIHVEGTSYSGTRLDLYQVISYDLEGIETETSVEANTSTDTNIDTKENGADKEQPTPTINQPKQSDRATKAQADSLVAVAPDEDEHINTDAGNATTPLPQNNKGNNGISSGQVLAEHAVANLDDTSSVKSTGSDGVTSWPTIYVIAAGGLGLLLICLWLLFRR